MYSMNYIGKFIANFREFYNEINGATLTGAIDVVVVEQPDGSFTCSPFHVRFGKLGVLRSRFKVVDLELNGEPLNIHMKLGESGEAFFVEEVSDEDAHWSAHLATSPIPDNRFEQLYEPPRRRNSISVGETADRPVNQISDFSQRRYTDSTMDKPEFSKKSKEYIAKLEDDSKTENQEHEALFEMEGLDDVTDNTSSGWKEGANAPKTFTPAIVDEPASEANEAVRKISVHNDFRPIADAPVEDLQQDDVKNGNGKKKKKTKKAGSKKKHQRKSSSSSNGYSSQSERAGSESRQTPAPAQSLAQPNKDLNFFSDSELQAAAISVEMSTLSLEKRIPLALSDTAFEICVASRHTTLEGRMDTPILSDTEAELTRNSGADKPQSWRWGELPEPPPRVADAAASPGDCVSPTDALSSDEERNARRGVLSNMFSFMKSREDTGGVSDGAGVYLDELAEGQVDPRLYLSKHHPQQPGTTGGLRVSLGGASEEEYESGNGPSLPQSPASLEPQHLDSDDDDKFLNKGCVGVYIREENSSVYRVVSYEEFLSSPNDLLSSSRLSVRVGDKYMPWSAAGPLLLSLLAYRRHLPNRVVESLVSRGAREPTPEAGAGPSKPRGYSWWSWRRSNPPQDTGTLPLTDQSKPTTVTEETSKDSPNETTASPIVTDEVLPKTEESAITKEELALTEMVPTTEDIPKDEAQNDDVSKTEEETSKFEEGVSDLKENETADMQDEEGRTEIDAGENSLEDNTMPTTEGVEPLAQDAPTDSRWSPPRSRLVTHRHSSDRFRKTLRLSSEQIKSLNLKEGMNEMVFSVTTAYQGTTRCKCNLFRWRYDDKVVISDIDGTITKSDVLGHIFPLVGKDWAQSGVAQLFTKINNNGYKLLYLSARAIGQAKVTREYLRSIKQGEVSLPDGPLLLNPTSLLRAFHREVIEKKPEEFKIQCLADIKALFPLDSNPFYAGYGNRVNDVCAYQAVGIPIVRIFTINYRGELKHEHTQTFQSTYSHMSVLVDQVFPPCLVEPCDDFSQAVYWREPMPSLDLTLPTIPEAQH